jgi:hypothetical protein
VVPEQREKQDDRQGNTEQPEQCTSSQIHGFLPPQRADNSGQRPKVPREELGTYLRMTPCAERAGGSARDSSRVLGGSNVVRALAGLQPR